MCILIINKHADEFKTYKNGLCILKISDNFIMFKKFLEFNKFSAFFKKILRCFQIVIFMN